jgi:hypothetical protein
MRKLAVVKIIKDESLGGQSDFPLGVASSGFSPHAVRQSSSPLGGVQMLPSRTPARVPHFSMIVVLASEDRIDIDVSRMFGAEGGT